MKFKRKNNKNLTVPLYEVSFKSPFNSPLKWRLKSPIKSEDGQLSIFLAAVVILVVTMIAFVVNVGLFVKAKINLQNAVDAAAFAGASVQARQLTNIAYLNWEMRNNYKEWVFKQYVLGQLGNPKVMRSTGAIMDFTLRTFGAGTSDANNFDRYNVPSICIHFGTPHNICEIYDVPGLPRFETPALPSIGEQHREFVDELVRKKSEDCSMRSQLNFATAVQWAYGVPGVAALADLGQVAAHRPGVWPVSLELAMRMRNLESIVNTPPEPGPVTVRNISSKMTDAGPMGNAKKERVVKAFMSAYRNLSGGGVKDGHDILANTFQLTELKPAPVGVDGLSHFFLKGASSEVSEKIYLDLQAIPLNLISFFTSFITKTQDPTQTGLSVESQGQCLGSKTGLPVLGVIIGFAKNPEVMTYYAVKGEAQFVGLFNPFKPAEIKLQAYAAAKPFGGRIGPHLFRLEGATVKGRDNNIAKLSKDYVAGFGVSGGYETGAPIPMGVNGFWMESASDPIGGVPGVGEQAKFGVPNLIYDYVNDGMSEASKEIEIIQPLPAPGAVTTDTGLYKGKQFEALRSCYDIGQDSGGVMAPDVVDKILDCSRKPTKYDAMNYLIPTIIGNDGAKGVVESLPTITETVGVSGGETPRYQLFAPLFGEGTLYSAGSEEISKVVTEYLAANSLAIDGFMKGLDDVAKAIRDQGSGELYIGAANSIYNPNQLLPIEGECQKASLAARFNVLFQREGGATLCGITPIIEQMKTYFAAQSTQEGYRTSYITTYYKNLTNEQLGTAFAPGPSYGGYLDGMAQRPVGGEIGYARKRNSYSVKLVSMNFVNGSMDWGNFRPLLENDKYDQNDIALKPLNFVNDVGGDLKEFGTLNH